MSGLLIIRVAIVGVLAAAGISKLRARATVTAAATELGLTGSLANFAGRWLAVLELTLAGLLLLGVTAYSAAVLALLLFVVFSVLIAWNLWQGRAPSCACFGQSNAEPISGWTLARNLLFVALAAALVISGREASSHGLLFSLGVAMEGPSTAALLGALVLLGLVQIIFGFVLWSEVGKLTLQLTGETSPNVTLQATTEAGWPAGTLAPSFNLPSLDGTRVSLADLMSRGREVVLLFISPECRPCIALIPEIADWQARLEDDLTIAVIGQGSAGVNRDKLGEFTVRDMLLQGVTEVADAYRSFQTPSAIVIGLDRRISSRIATGAVSIRELVRARAAATHANVPLEILSPPPPADSFSPAPGDTAPPFELESLRGGPVDLTDFAGRMILLLFWDAGCSFCRQLSPALQLWEREQTDGSIQMVLVGKGGRIFNETQPFSSPFLLDVDGSVSATYGVPGTPSGILIDAESRIVSPLARGGGSVMALLQRGQLLARAAWTLEAHQPAARR